MVFVQQHGGKDLEGFVLLNFDEARTLLVQVCFTCYYCTCLSLQLNEGLLHLLNACSLMRDC